MNLAFSESIKTHVMIIKKLPSVTFNQIFLIENQVKEFALFLDLF